MQHQALDELNAAQSRSASGWATDACSVAKSFVRNLRHHGLCEMAGEEAHTVLEQESRTAVVWATRLTPEGHDVLAYRAARSAASAEGPPTAAPGPGLREVELRPAEMRALRIFLSCDGQLRKPAAEGLAEAARTARFVEESNRWVLRVDDDQLASIARAFFLEGLTGQVTAANRISRTYGVTYEPY